MQNMLAMACLLALGAGCQGPAADHDPVAIERPFLAINYYPRDHAWEAMWSEWDRAAAAMAEDMEAIRSIGANSVRLFVPPSQFGWDEPDHQPTAAQMERFEQALSRIRDADLAAIPTLFDLLDITHESTDDCQAWMEGFLSQLSDEARATVALWELRNELDLTEPLQRAWVLAIFPRFEVLAAPQPVSLSLSMTAEGVREDWRDSLDFALHAVDTDLVGLHWYPWHDIIWLETAEADLAAAVESAGDPARLMLGELGYSTGGVHSEGSQAQVLARLANLARGAGIEDFGIWTLHDFPDGTHVGDITADVYELSYGIRDLEGDAKQAEAVVDAVFSGGTPSDSLTLINGSFEEVDPRTGEVDGWLSWVDGIWRTGDLAPDGGVAHGGNRSARITVADPNARTVGMFHIPGFPVDQDSTYTLQAWARTEDPDANVQLVFSWFSWDGSGEPEYLSNSAYAGPTVVAQDWSELDTGPTMPVPDANLMQVFVHVTGAQPGTTVWIDDLVLTVSRP